MTNYKYKHWRQWEDYDLVELFSKTSFWDLARVIPSNIVLANLIVNTYYIGWTKKVGKEIRRIAEKTVIEQSPLGKLLYGN